MLEFYYKKGDCKMLYARFILFSILIVLSVLLWLSMGYRFDTFNFFIGMGMFANILGILIIVLSKN